MIKTKGLSKKYGKIYGIRGLDMEIPDGMIFGLLGPNGAGKTTTLKILSCILKPSSGEATINTYSILEDQKNIKKIVSYLPEEIGLYEDMKANDYLLFFADLYDIDRAEAKAKIKDMASKLGMSKRMDSKIHTLSKGMKKKVALMRVLLPDPQIIFLDELTEGIDPITRKMLMEWVLEMNRDGKTIVYSTHNLHEAEGICDEVAILNKGELVARGQVSQLKKRFGANNLEDVFFKVIRYRA